MSETTAEYQVKNSRKIERKHKLKGNKSAPKGKFMNVNTFTCLRNFDIGKNMFADNTATQIWARDVLPILVRRAQARRTIKFSELTHALGLSGGYYNLLMGDVFRHISTTLVELEQADDWDGGQIPHITSIVLNARGECSRNMCESLTGDSAQQPSPERLQAELNCSFNYEKWDAVLAALGLPEAPS